VKPARNALGQRVFTEDDIARLIRWRSQRGDNLHEQLELAKEEGRVHQGGDVKLVVEGNFDGRAKVQVSVRELYPDGRMEGGPWKPLLAFSEPGVIERDLFPCVVLFTVEPGEFRDSIKCRLEPATAEPAAAEQVTP
jgi:DNA-binding transcriptional MerR regulator